MTTKNQLRLLLLAIIIVSLTSYTDTYPEPIYYVQDDLSTENCVIKYARSIQDDLNGKRHKIAKIVNKRHVGMSQDDLTELYSYEIYRETKDEIEDRINKITSDE